MATRACLQNLRSGVQASARRLAFTVLMITQQDCSSWPTMETNPNESSLWPTQGQTSPTENIVQESKWFPTRHRHRHRHRQDQPNQRGGWTQSNCRQSMQSSGSAQKEPIPDARDPCPSYLVIIFILPHLCQQLLGCFECSSCRTAGVSPAMTSQSASGTQ